MDYLADNMVTTTELITPEMAAEYLTRNKTNRILRERDVNSIARDIVNGNFKLTHQGIAFDSEGNLIDGQHRLTACVKAGVPIYIRVTRGTEFKNAAYVDIGIKRTLQDGFAFTGKYSDSPALRNKSMSGAIRKLVFYGYNSNVVLTNAEMETFLDAFRDELETLYKCSSSRKSTPSPINAAALSALLCGESSEDIFKYFSIFLNGDSSGCEGHNISAVYNWNRQLMDAKLHHTTFQNAKVYSSTQNSIWNFIHTDNSKLIRATKISRYPVAKIIKAILDRNVGYPHPVEK